MDEWASVMREAKAKLKGLSAKEEEEDGNLCDISVVL
jgi:hypothetical protein